jgi:hypothetical protein
MFVLHDPNSVLFRKNRAMETVKRLVIGEGHRALRARNPSVCHNGNTMVTSHYSLVQIHRRDTPRPSPDINNGLGVMLVHQCWPHRL